MKFDLVVVGGGAAGFFGAINAALNNPSLKIVILEKNEKFLSKVKISGGGRCNITNSCNEINQLVENYPRGGKALKKIFKKFSTTDTIKWFNNFGVELKDEEDGRIFPTSNKSETVINLFLKLVDDFGIKIFKGYEVVNIEPINKQFEITSSNQEKIMCNKVLLTTGGFNKLAQYRFIEKLGIKIINPVPSLFTFNLRKHPITQLMGLSVKSASVRIIGFKYEAFGPVLITHWGFSGPAILKLSAYAAHYLAQKNYRFQFSVNWLGYMNFDEVRHLLKEQISKHAKGQIKNYALEGLPKRLWEFLLLHVAEIPFEKRWNELSKKEINKLSETLTNHLFNAEGKTTFKEEFVTAGGISLEEVNPETMECKKIPGLYFAGEILDIDGVTGGFNFQAAWSTSFVAARHLAN